MSTILKVTSMIVRVAVLVVLILGVSFWFNWINTDTNPVLLDIHEIAGMLIGLGLLLVGTILIARGGNASLGIVSIILAILLPIVGMGQANWLAGDIDPHWLIQLSHLALGLGAFALVEIGSRRAQKAVALVERAEKEKGAC
jgi:hypothetical protein